ncbi:MAG: branched-chain amino acid ABC transporter permease [Rhodoferax sp.]|jgi:branched-chain amino acid transport system permease protein|nr:branched-chain amino acid ABC transporter permease [Rhodoferax sp.]MCF8210430.1 branched-chain amino acid ABC transporter permease [Rhodoferax sp.]
MDQTLLFSLFNGLLYGMLLFMLSSGLTLIFSMMGVLNFAHASFFMLGAYFAHEISRSIGFWPALLLAPLAVALLGALVQAVGLRRLHQRGHVAELLFTFGLVYVIEEMVVFFWGRLPVAYRIPKELDFALFSLFGINYSAYRIFMLAVAVLSFVCLALVLTRTRIGLIVRAALSQPEMLRALGHDVPKVFMGVFAGGCALAGLAGVIGGNYFTTQPTMAMQLGTIIFVVVVIGGLGSLAGALIASLIVGIVQTVSVAVDISLAPILPVKLSEIGALLPYVLMVMVLIFKPKGLMGKRES